MVRYGDTALADGIRDAMIAVPVVPLPQLARTTYMLPYMRDVT